MPQAPATRKTKRALLRVAAALSPALARALRPSTSEAEALAARTRPLARPTAPHVVFLIPLVGPHQVNDWAAVCARLARTLQSFRRQTAPGWTALICGQVAPDGVPDDARVRFLPFTEAVSGNDKWRKLAALCAALPDAGAPRGYAMPFDADDLLAPHVVAEMTDRRVPGGYLIERGYVHDARTGGWAETRPQSLLEPGQKGFWKLCGSCAAFGYDLTQSTRDSTLIGAITAHEHRMFPYLSALAGRPLRALAPGAALYILNHGDNFGARRGRVGFKSRFVERFPVPPDRIPRLAGVFGLA